ncbi:OsmC family protein [Caldinitratiruptor microaerophilus]|uniref:OsmC-like protein n=1 Tax=Caldinitratiruptor microaerophilus TaxID=671077 RepID=A0AA35CMX0_9FIRM|nr:OsmC family protein [Caldinitratiruptor microaerophilus]BDG62077.1 OsmC-like protein [Caldinitratiruptor microaerophilus]
MKQATVTWEGDMLFKATTGTGHAVLMDAAESAGGKNTAARPADLVLVALGGCTGMDVVSILRKMRIPFDRFEVALESDNAEEHPKVFRAIRVVYRLWGEGVPVDRYLRAIELSWTRYCSVSNTLKHAAHLTYRAELNGQEVGRGEHPAPALSGERA